MILNLMSKHIKCNVIHYNFLNRVNSKEIFAVSTKILFEINNFYQAQDDYLDIYGDPILSGKVGTDIKENKCSWFALKCMELANPAQKLILQQNYGKDDPQKVQRVKDLFEELNLKQHYDKYVVEQTEKIKNLIEENSNKIPAQLFLWIMKVFNGRTV